MYKCIIFTFCCLFFLLHSGEPYRCYHCYERYNNAFISTSGTFGEKFVPCDKDPKLWNVYDCPSKWPVCVIMKGSVNGTTEIARSCAERDFCSKYVPPSGVKVESCRECESHLCNDYPDFPKPPVGPGPIFNFNININLNLKKYPMTNVDKNN